MTCEIAVVSFALVPRWEGAAAGEEGQPRGSFTRAACGACLSRPAPRAVHAHFMPPHSFSSLRRARCGPARSGRWYGVACWGLTFLGGTIAIASLGGIEMWCGLLSFSPFIDRRNCGSAVSTGAWEGDSSGCKRTWRRRSHLHGSAGASERAGKSGARSGGERPWW
jgi:hypothetical protein